MPGKDRIVVDFDLIYLGDADIQVEWEYEVCHHVAGSQSRFRCLELQQEFVTCELKDELDSFSARPSLTSPSLAVFNSSSSIAQGFSSLSR